MSDNQHTWNESDSENFLQFNEIITPSRSEQMALLADLVPAKHDETFQFVELGHGGGEWAAFLLERFPHASYLGLDGSLTMRNATEERLHPYASRVELRECRLEEQETWTRTLPPSIRCIFSSLVVHHLPDPKKQELYSKMYELLEPEGALLLVDIVLPENRPGQDAIGRNWDTVVKQQSQAATGSLQAYDTFKRGGWNCYSDPDPMDLPASLFAQLKWLEQAGFKHVDSFWQRGGHALYGGYK